MPDTDSAKIKTKYTFITDPGHGWLVVPLDDVHESGADISSCSYIRGRTAYLEEDCDAWAFLKTLPRDAWEIVHEHREQFDIRENPAYRRYS